MQPDIEHTSEPESEAIKPGLEYTQPDTEDTSELDCEAIKPGLEYMQPDTEDTQDTSGDAQLLELAVEPDDEDPQPGSIQHSAAISLWFVSFMVGFN